MTTLIWAMHSRLSSVWLERPAVDPIGRDRQVPGSNPGGGIFLYSKPLHVEADCIKDEMSGKWSAC